MAMKQNAVVSNRGRQPVIPQTRTGLSADNTAKVNARAVQTTNSRAIQPKR